MPISELNKPSDNEDITNIESKTTKKFPRVNSFTSTRLHSEIEIDEELILSNEREITQNNELQTKKI